MHLILLNDADEVCDYAARYICKRICEFQPTKDRPFTLGLPTVCWLLCGTMMGMYQRLVEMHRSGRVSFQHVITFNMDEYIGIPKNHPQSYHSYMYHNFFRHVDIQAANVHILEGNAVDLEKECNDFENKINSFGGIQLFVGGIGTDGHVAFNEPGSSMNSRTRVVTLAEDTIRANARFFNNDVSQVPTMALTVGVGTIMAAAEVMLLACGAHKAMAVRRAVEKGVNHMCTASIFQMHTRTMFVCDEQAALELKLKTVKYFKVLLPHYVKMVDDGNSRAEIDSSSKSS